MGFARPFRVLWDAICQFAEHRCIELAASLAFYTILSLAPLLVLMISIVGDFVEPQNVEGKAVRNGEHDSRVRAAPSNSKTVTGTGSLAGGSLWAKLANLAVLVVGATGVMVQLQAALNRIWDVAPAPRKRTVVARFLLDRVFSIGMIFSLAFLLFLSLAVTPAVLAAARPLSDLLGDGDHAARHRRRGHVSYDRAVVCRDVQDAAEGPGFLDTCRTRRRRDGRLVSRRQVPHRILSGPPAAWLDLRRGQLRGLHPAVDVLFVADFPLRRGTDARLGNPFR